MSFEGASPARTRLLFAEIAAQERFSAIEAELAAPELEPEALEALEVTLSELRSALEELSVAGEALGAQQAELVAAQALVEAERRRYEDLFVLAPVAQLVTDAHGIVGEANLAAEDLLGVRPRFLAGKALALFVTSEDRQEFRAGMAALASAPDTQHWPVRMAGRGGTAFPAEVTVSPIRDRADQVETVRWVVADATDQVRVADDLNALTERFEERVEQRTAALSATNERLLSALREVSNLSEQLQHALDSRVVIEQAKGRLIEALAVSADGAFELLRRRARDTGRKLREVASEVADGSLRLQGEDPDPEPRRDVSRSVARHARAGPPPT